MRRLTKLKEPELLSQNGTQWLAEYQADPNSSVKRYRYREQSIKATLKDETKWKCVYCESKIGHNTPGDVEHKIPTSKEPTLHFTWSNLTVACGECNRRKRDYYQIGNEFLDPYSDDVENLVIHHGPLPSWQPGSIRSETTIKLLQFSHQDRLPLVLRKIEKIREFENVLERYLEADDPVHKEVLLRQLREMRSIDGEYSAMLIAVGRSKGIPD